MKERKDVHCDAVIHYNNTVDLDMKNCVVLENSNEKTMELLIKDAKTGVNISIVFTKII